MTAVLAQEHGPKIIGISGKAGHGKDSVGAWLTQLGYRRFSFAEPLKDIAYDLNPQVGFARVRNLVDQMGWDQAKQDAEVRRLLQALGTAAREHLDKGVWVRAAMRRVDDHVKAGGLAVITDVRYENEAEAIVKRDGLMVRVNRPSVGWTGDHPSETDLDDYLFGEWVENTGTLEDLHRRLERIAITRYLPREVLESVA